MGSIFVTGASGYIGSYLARFLASRGHRVAAGARRPSAELAEALPGCRLVELDVLSNPKLPDGKWDGVFHVATANDILSRDFCAGTTLSACGTKNLLAAARAAGAGHFVFFSTLQVYGSELEGVVEESTSPAPENDYALNHLFGEMVCRLESGRTGLATTVVRPSNVFGCPASPTVDRWSLVPMCFVRQALAEGRITLRSSGRQRRDFVSLRQVAEACEAIVETGSEGFRVRNVAGGETCRILDVARWTADAFGLAGLPVPEVEILGSDPASENAFEVRCSVPPSARPGGLAAEMRSEICEMIDFFQRKPTEANRPT